MILATAFSAGRMHEFKLFKLFKNRKRHPLTPEQKRQSRQLARERFVAEHLIRSLKIFRVLSERYRDRGRRFGLRFNLIAAIYNHELCD